MSDLKSQLGTLLSKAAPKAAAPEPSKEPISIDCAVTTLPEPPRKLDALITTPVNPQPTSKPWEPAIPVAEPMTPKPPEIDDFKIARQRIYDAAKNLEAQVDALLKLTYGDDLMGKAMRDRVYTILWELETLMPELKQLSQFDVLYGGIKEREKPEEYRARDNHAVNTNPQAAVTTYEPPSATALWARNAQK